MTPFHPALIDRDGAVQALAPAFDRSRVYHSGEWVQRCIDDVAQLWCMGDYWAITEVVEFPDGRALHVVALAGKMHDELHSSIEAFAKLHGCSRVYGTCRPGYGRALKDYKVITVTIEKEI